MSKIWLSLAHMGGAEQDFVREAFDTNWVVPLGPNVDGFERELSAWLSERANREVHAVALSSGTAAIHLALVMLGVEAGDEVICQSFTFTASAAIFSGIPISILTGIIQTALLSIRCCPTRIVPFIVIGDFRYYSQIL